MKVNSNNNTTWGAETCSVDYETEYYKLQELAHKLAKENDDLKQALVNIALKLF